MGLSKEQIARYGRQLMLPAVGVSGQERLQRSAVLLIGAGGLGSPAALYLAAAGVGRLILVDPETVALSNLHRQILYVTADAGRSKVQSAAARLVALNPDVTVETVRGRFTAENALPLLAACDVVLDGSDNFSTRYLANDACVLAGKPLVHGAAVRLGGQLLTVLPRRSACFRCVFPEPPGPGAVPGCQEAGVLGPAVGVIGALMAQEALKMLLGIGETLADRLVVFDGTAARFREVPVRRDRGCAVCGDAPTIRTLAAIEAVECVDVQRSGVRVQMSEQSDI